MHSINPIIYEVVDGYAGYAAELPAATGQGKTVEDTVSDILCAIEELVEEYEMRKVPVPWEITTSVKPVVIEV